MSKQSEIRTFSTFSILLAYMKSCVNIKVITNVTFQIVRRNACLSLKYDFECFLPDFDTRTQDF